LPYAKHKSGKLRLVTPAGKILLPAPGRWWSRLFHGTAAPGEGSC